MLSIGHRLRDGDLVQCKSARRAVDGMQAQHRVDLGGISRGDRLCRSNTKVASVICEKQQVSRDDMFAHDRQAISRRMVVRAAITLIRTANPISSAVATAKGRGEPPVTP